MKIALFTETYYPDINGVAAHVDTLRDGLEQLGHEVLIVTADKHCKHHYIQNGVLHCPSVAVKRFYGFGVATPFSRKRKKMIADFAPDIIHIHHEFGIGLSGVFASKRLSVPLIYTLHTMYDQYIFYIAPRILHGAATKFSHRYERYIASHAHALTGPSQKCDEYFKRIDITKETSIIPNSADLTLFGLDKVTPEQKKRALEKHNIPQDKTLAIFVGRLGKEKSIDVLLEFWKNTIKAENNLHLVIVGGGPDEESLRLMAKGLGIDNQVSFTGMIPHDEIPAYFAACDAFVTASLSEMNSISMLEGMASGLPTLQRYDQLNASQIIEGVNGWLYQTQEEFAELLLKIAAMTPEEKAAMKNTVYGSVVDRGQSDLAKYMLGIYDKAIKEKEASPARQRPILFR